MSSGNVTAEAATRLSHVISEEIAASGRPFTDGGFIKKGLILACDEVCPEKKA